MRCIDAGNKHAWRGARLCGGWATLLCLALAGCQRKEAPPPVPALPQTASAATAAASAVFAASAASAAAHAASGPARAPAATAATSAPQPPAALAHDARRHGPRLPPPEPPHSLAELKQMAARRMVAAHPATSYLGTPPEPLLGIPVLQVELNANGSVRRIEVLREPRQAKETIQMAIDIVRRAAPYGDVSRLPKPWVFVEVFLFDDDHRFKPATLDR